MLAIMKRPQCFDRFSSALPMDRILRPSQFQIESNLSLNLSFPNQDFFNLLQLIMSIILQIPLQISMNLSIFRKGKEKREYILP